MTADTKALVATLLDLAEDRLRDGYRTERQAYTFSDDTGKAPPAAASASAASPGISGDSLELVSRQVASCDACILAKTRKNTVPGEGAQYPLVMVIGEGPGADEDASGRPFVGKAGQLLDKMLSAVGLSRESNCFIANLVKCRPPGNRDPEPGEVSACATFLDRQITLLKPRIILSVGRVPTQNLLKTTEGIGLLRGRFVDYRGIPFLPTYHPSALLRDESLKRPAWEDLKLLKARLDADPADNTTGTAP